MTELIFRKMLWKNPNKLSGQTNISATPGKTSDALVFKVITMLEYMDSYLLKKQTKPACLLDNPLKDILALIWFAILLLTVQWIEAPAQSASILQWHNTNTKLLEFQQHYLPAHLIFTVNPETQSSCWGHPEHPKPPC